MPIIEVTKHHDSSRSVPLQILNKGPEYFRQQALRNQRRQGKSAAEQLAESRSQYLKRDLSPPAQLLNDNSNNHVTDNRLIHSRQYATDRNAALVADNASKHERIEVIEFEKQESKRGRDRHRDSKRGRRRGKGQTNDLNGNKDTLDVCEKASLDSPEYDCRVKETELLVGIGHCNTSGPTDNADSPTRSHGYRSPRPSVREIVSKLGGHAALENQDQPGYAQKTVQSGRQRSKKAIHLASSESSETSPILPRKMNYATRSSRPSAVRSRERSKPSLPAKPSSKIFEKKSPRGSHVQNILNVLHQQTSTSSSSYDDTPRRSSRSSGARIRGKSCPPTSRTKPSLADLLAKDAEDGRPRSKDLNDLENFVSTDSEGSNFVAVKARIRTLQSPRGTSAQLSLPKPISKTLSNVMKALHEQACSAKDTQGETKVEEELTQRQSTSTTPKTHFSKTDSSNSKLNDGRSEPVLGKQTNIMLDSSNMYALPLKDPVKSKEQVQEHALSENSQSSGSSVKQKVNLIAKGEFGSMKNVSSDSGIAVAKKPVLQTRSADAAVQEKQEVSKSALRPVHLNKPELPRKPDISVFAKASRLSYHIYEVVPEDISRARQGEAPAAAGDNVFENPAHFSDPEDSFEVVTSSTFTEGPTASSIGPAAGNTGPDNVAVISEEQHAGKEGPKQGSMLSSLSSHMKRLKGILLRDKDQQNVTKEQGKACDDVFKSGTGKSENKRLKYDSPTQRKLAAQLGIESDEEREGGRHNKYSVVEGIQDEHIYTENSTSVEQHCNLNEEDETRRVGDPTSDQNLKLMLPIHAKSLSLDDISKKAEKPPLSESVSLPSANDDQVKKGLSTDQDPSSSERFTMPHDKQKKELSKKLEMFLKQSKAYESGGESPSKESCDSGKLKKKVSFDDTSISADTTDKQSERNTRKVSITPLCLNYDVVEYNTDWHKDQVEETIVIDRNNTIRLATPRTHAIPQTVDSAPAEKKIPRVREDAVVPKESEKNEGIPKDEIESTDGKQMEGVYDDIEMSNIYSNESSLQPKPSSGSKREPASEDIQGARSGDALKSSKLLDFRKASVSTDLDTSPTHDYRTATREGLSDVKQRCGTSSSGNAVAKGEYDTSSRSDDCGLGVSRGKVKHLKPYNARPFRNKNFSSDEDVIPEEHTRKSFWQTKAQLDLPSSQQKTVGTDQNAATDGDSESADTQSAMHRSKSEPSNATLASELNSFFDQMGLEDAILELVGKPHIYDEEEVFHDMHVWRTRTLQSSESDDSNTSYAMSETSNVSEDGVMNLRKFTKQLPDQSMSIVTKNARVIKWLCQCTKARKQSVS
ncbi:uncharacterized protein [Diadema antillarum]|uniref:uncharacterized protein n=1 Tax=Diadema antillarum TaxID=105358 RepID=UPI003A8AF0B0